MSAVAPAASPSGQILIYEVEGGEARVDVRFDRDTVWLTQRQIADLFETSTDNISLHLTNIFSTRELERESTTEESSVVRTEGSRQVRRTLTHYNLDAIISVGYRVNSQRGVHFRQWATRTLRDHLVRGFTLNQQRLAERGTPGSPRNPGPAGRHVAQPGARGYHRARSTGPHRRLRRHLAAAAGI